MKLLPFCVYVCVIFLKKEWSHVTLCDMQKKWIDPIKNWKGGEKKMTQVSSGFEPETFCV